jgi:hypothetical protein
MSIDLSFLDNQIKKWGSKLSDDLMILPCFRDSLATTVYHEITSLKYSQKQELKEITPVPISDRLDEIWAFQKFMDYVSTQKSNQPYIVRTQVIVQNYICFVYFKDNFYLKVSDFLPRDSTTVKCCNYLSTGDIKHFRNSFAHGNWKYRKDFKGIEYWDRSHDSLKNIYFYVDQMQLEFWQSLSRCVSISILLGLQYIAS